MHEQRWSDSSHSLNICKDPILSPHPLYFSYFWIREAGMLIKVYMIVGSGSCLWEFQVLLQLWEELTNLARVVGRHLYECQTAFIPLPYFGAAVRHRQKLPAPVTRGAEDEQWQRPVPAPHPSLHLWPCVAQSSTGVISPHFPRLSSASASAAEVNAYFSTVLVPGRHMLLPKQVAVAFRGKKNIYIILSGDKPSFILISPNSWNH